MSTQLEWERDAAARSATACRGARSRTRSGVRRERAGGAARRVVGLSAATLKRCAHAPGETRKPRAPWSPKVAPRSRTRRMVLRWRALRQRFALDEIASRWSRQESSSNRPTDARNSPRADRRSRCALRRGGHDGVRDDSVAAVCACVRPVWPRGYKQDTWKPQDH